MKNLVLICMSLISYYSQGNIDFTIQKAHSSSVVNIDFIENNKILSTDVQNNIVLWDINTEKVFYVGKKGDFDYQTKNNKGSQFVSSNNTENLHNDKFKAQIADGFKLIMWRQDGGMEFWTRDELGNKILSIEYSEKHKVFLVGLSNGDLLFLHAKSGRLIKRMSIHSASITALRINEDQNLLVTASNDRSFCLIDLNNKKLKTRLFGTSYHIRNVQFSEDGSSLWFSDETGKISNLDFSKNIPELISYAKNTSDLMAFYFSEGVVTGFNSNNKLISYNLNKEHLKKYKWVKKQFPYDFITKVKKIADFTLTTKYSEIKKSVTSTSGNFIAVYHHLFYPKENDEYKTLSIVNTKTKKISHIRSGTYSIDFFEDHFLYISKKNKLTEEVVKLENKPLYLPNDDMSRFTVIEDELILYQTLSGKELKLFNPKNGKKKTIKYKTEPNGTFSYKNGLFFDDNGTTLKVYMLKKDSLILYKTIPESVYHFDVHPNKNTIVISNTLGVVKFYKLDDIAHPVSFATSLYDDYAFYDNDHHYYIPKRKLDFIGINYNDNYVFPYQFDKYFNRPDIVLYNTGLISESFRDLLAKSIAKRTTERGQIELPNFKEIPVVSIIDKIEMGDSIVLNLTIESKIKHGSIICRINGVVSLQKNITNTEDVINLSIPKINGNNKYEISFINTDKIESVRQYFEFESEMKTVKPELFILSIGVSEYEQSEFNLIYANKDAQDFSNCIKEQTKNLYKKSHSLIITNKEATREKILESIETFLNKSNINDVVILFMAGHGILDKQLNYYFGNTDINFLHPEENGLSFDEIERLLSRIKANKKLLIMDTCHSGEIDKEETFEDVNEIKDVNDEIIFRKGNKTYKTTSKQTTLELSKAIFFDMNNASGANIIASASGNEYAMETNEFKNGIFTYVLMKSLENKVADANKDGELWLNEIRNYTYREVVKLSNGKQHPTIRSENLLTNFRLK